MINGKIIDIVEKEDSESAVYYVPLVEYNIHFNNENVVLSFVANTRLINNSYKENYDEFVRNTVNVIYLDKNGEYIEEIFDKKILLYKNIEIILIFTFLFSVFPIVIHF